MPTFGEGMEDYSTRSQDSNYQALRRQADQMPTWTQQSSQYPEISTVYGTQPSPMYQNQPYSAFRHPQVLPSIHDAQPRSDKMTNGMNGTRAMPMSSYPTVSGYGQSAVNRVDLQNGMFDSRRGTSYYDQQTQRHAQNYSPATRHDGSNIDYQAPAQYQPRYDPYRSHGSYASSYTDIDYASQSTPVPPSNHFNVMGENVDPRGKRRRGNLPKPVTDILRAWFHEHLDHPYPTEEDKQQFMQRTGLTLNQISNWFINARRRQLPSLRQNRSNQMQHRDQTDRYRSQESSTEPR